MKSAAKLLQFFFPNSCIWKTTSDFFHLTFDDGPHPIATPRVLETLRKHNVQAAFFLTGKNVEKFPDIAKQIISDGHIIGNHSYEHKNLIFRSKTFLESQIDRTVDIFQKILGVKTELFRPPYGPFDPFLIKFVNSRGLKIVMYNVDPKDYRNHSAQKIAGRIQKSITPGDIILLHTNNQTEKKTGDVLEILFDRIESDKFKQVLI